MNKKHINWIFSRPKDMLQINLSQAEISTTKLRKISRIVSIGTKKIECRIFKSDDQRDRSGYWSDRRLSRQWISHCVKEYQSGGIDALYRFNYGTNKSQLETHTVSILQSFTEKPPRNAREAKSVLRK